VSPEAQTILDYWFGEVGPDGWWTRSDSIDATIRTCFGDVWAAWRSRTAESFLGSADEALAAIVLFDQFPRNMFRGQADAFATDSLALAIAKGAVAAGLDDGLDRDRRIFLYLPFEHSEDMDDQDRSLALFTALGDDESLDFAKKHRDMIAKFGRFPHRNAVLGRHDRPGEAEAAMEGSDW